MADYSPMRLPLLALLLLVFLSTVAALRCYNCNSRSFDTCVDLSEKCTHNINCRADFVGICSNMENSCAVVYGPNNQVWRGCYNDPKNAIVSNDQQCTTNRDGTTTCLCRVDMCNASSKPSRFPLFSTLVLVCSVFFVAL